MENHTRKYLHPHLIEDEEMGCSAGSWGMEGQRWAWSGQANFAAEHKRTTEGNLKRQQSPTLDYFPVRLDYIPVKKAAYVAYVAFVAYVAYVAYLTYVAYVAYVVPSTTFSHIQTFKSRKSKRNM